MKKVYIGKVVNTFGIKGELKVSSNFEFPEKAFVKGQVVIIDDEELIINSAKLHKGNYLIRINNLNDINLVLDYLNKKIFIDSKNLKLNDNEYLMTDLIGMKVIDNDKEIGIVTDIIYNKINPLIKINDKFYIPLKGNYITKIEVDKKIINGNNIEELIL